MATLIRMRNLKTGEIVNMYSADAREAVSLKNPEYAPVSEKGEAAVKSKPEKILSKEARGLVPAAVNRGDGTRGGVQPAPAAPAEVDQPGGKLTQERNEAGPEQPAPATGPANPSDTLMAAIAGQGSPSPDPI